MYLGTVKLGFKRGGCFTCVGPSQMARPNSYRLMNSPITRSCMRSVLEKHPLEGSRQEAILPLAQLLTTFFCCVPSGTPRSQLVAADASLFSCVWCRLGKRRTKHPSGSRPLPSRSHARRLPLAPSVPQKTVGSLPRPIVYSSQMPWLPWGSRFPMAHGRGVARLHNPSAGSLG
jgi:hypothetical protein